MSDPHAAAAPGAPEAHAGGHHTNYVKVWALLCGLLVVSVIGPFIGAALNAFWITLITAFGIAVVKAYLVATKFMHINLEKKFIAYLVVTMLVLMALFYGGVSPDIMKHEGQRWENYAAKAETKRRMADTNDGHGSHGAAPAHGEAAPAHGEKPAEHH
jgi:caa(3)-type oxidase subunit IV